MGSQAGTGRVKGSPNGVTTGRSRVMGLSTAVAAGVAGGAAVKACTNAAPKMAAWLPHKLKTKHYATPVIPINNSRLQCRNERLPSFCMEGWKYSLPPPQSQMLCMQKWHAIQPNKLCAINKNIGSVRVNKAWEKEEFTKGSKMAKVKSEAQGKAAYASAYSSPAAKQQSAVKM